MEPEKRISSNNDINVVHNLDNNTYCEIEASKKELIWEAMREKSIQKLAKDLSNYQVRTSSFVFFMLHFIIFRYTIDASISG